MYKQQSSAAFLPTQTLRTSDLHRPVHAVKDVPCEYREQINRIAENQRGERLSRVRDGSDDISALYGLLPICKKKIELA